MTATFTAASTPTSCCEPISGWAGKDNVPTLIRLVQTPGLPFWNPRKTGLVMEALGKTQDEQAAEALAAKLADPVLHNPAVTALESMGPKAQKAVLPYLFDGDPATRLQASQLLANLGAKPQTIADEALARLRSGQTDVRRAAVIWFVDNSPGEGARKDDAAKALADLLDDPSPEVRARRSRRSGSGRPGNACPRCWRMPGASKRPPPATRC